MLRTFILLLFLLQSSTVFAQEMKVFRSQEHRFSVAYPSQWLIEPAMASVTVFKVVSPDGGVDYSVGVSNSTPQKNMTSEEFLVYAQKTGFVSSSFKKAGINIRLLKENNTYISNTPALKTLMSYKIRLSGVEVDVVSLTYYVVKYGKTYMVSIKGLDGIDLFNKNENYFDYILKSFVFE